MSEMSLAGSLLACLPFRSSSQLGRLLGMDALVGNPRRSPRLCSVAARFRQAAQPVVARRALAFPDSPSPSPSCPCVEDCR